MSDQWGVRWPLGHISRCRSGEAAARAMARAAKHLGHEAVAVPLADELDTTPVEEVTVNA